MEAVYKFLKLGVRLFGLFVVYLVKGVIGVSEIVWACAE